MEPSPQLLVFGSVVLESAQSHKNEELVKIMKQSLLDSFIKLSISTKVKPQDYIVEQCQPLLKCLNHEEFKSILLPALLKAMLRSPEIILGYVSLVLASIKLDLSPYAAELGKPIAACLHSNEDSTREAAVSAAESLAKQCSDASAVKGLFTLYFGVLQGSEGKLTVTSHKISVLDGIGRLSKHIVTGAGVNQLSADVADGFVKILESEVHEGTLLKALDVLSLWTTRLTSSVPKSLMEMFKKGMTLKTTTPGIRTAYIRCMAASLHGESLPQGLDLIPTLLKSLERVVAQPTQVAVVSEGLAAAALLLELSAADPKV